MPPLGVNVSRFPEDDQVQRPLQDIYGQFLEALVDVLKIVSETTVGELDKSLISSLVDTDSTSCRD